APSPPAGQRRRVDLSPREGEKAPVGGDNKVEIAKPYFRLLKTSRGTSKEKVVEIKVCNFDLYCPIRAVHTSPSGYRYANRPLPDGSTKNRPSSIDFGRWRPIEEEIDRWQSIEEEKGKKKRKRKKKRSGEYLARGRFFSRVRRRSISPCKEKDRGDVTPFLSFF
ncbi:hypothetical protein GW17_00036015, partial [Ensete ventricosum]